MEKIRTRVGLCVALVVAMTLVGTSIADAAAWCLYTGTTPSGIPRLFIVMKTFSKPKKSSCKQFPGYEGSGSLVGGVATVTICLNAVGDSLYGGAIVYPFRHHAATEGSSTSVLGFDFPYPSLTGGRITSEELSTASRTSGVIADSSLAECRPAPIP